jgi:hypothetical protein
MYHNPKIMWAIEEQLRREQEELQDAEIITKKTFPIFSKLEKKDILNEVKLFLKLFGLDSEYRLAVYYLFRIAVERGCDGSFVVLDPPKAYALASEKQREKIQSMNSGRLKTFCSIINMVNQRELTKPLTDMIINLGAQALNQSKTNSRQK